MRRFSYIACTVFLCLSLSACGSASNSSKDVSTDTESLLATPSTESIEDTYKKDWATALATSEYAMNYLSVATIDKANEESDLSAIATRLNNFSYEVSSNSKDMFYMRWERFKVKDKGYKYFYGVFKGTGYEETTLMSDCILVPYKVKEG